MGVDEFTDANIFYFGRARVLPVAGLACAVFPAIRERRCYTRREGISPDPVLLSSALGDCAIVENARETGANAYGPDADRMWGRTGTGERSMRFNGLRLPRGHFGGGAVSDSREI